MSKTCLSPFFSADSAFLSLSVFPVLAALFLLAALLSGCSGQFAPLPDQSGSAASEASGENASPSPYVTEISFWFSGSNTGIHVMHSIVDDFNRSQSNYRVNVTTFASYSEIYGAVQAAIATGTAPDIALLERDASIELHAKRLTVDLTQILKRDVRFNPSRFLSVYYDQGVSESGEIFAMPLYGTTQVLYYNRAAFAGAGIDPESIRTWQDLAAAAAAIQGQGLCTWGWEPMWGYENMLDAVLSNGGSLYSPDGRTVTINTEEWVSVWEAFRRWIHEDRIMRIHSGGYGWEYWDYTMRDALSGAAGGYTGSSGDQADVDFQLVGMMEQPAWEEGEQPLPGAQALLLNVLATSDQERQIGAYALIRYLIDVPAQVKWSIGTGYIAVNQAVLRDQDYQDYLETHEYAQIPLTQSMHASVYPYDPTGGQVRAALIRAADRIQIENLSAREALNEAQRTAQAALDAVLEQEAQTESTQEDNQKDTRKDTQESTRKGIQEDTQEGIQESIQKGGDTGI